MTEDRRYLTADELVNVDRVLPEDDVEVPGLGWVRVRGLSRTEGLAIKDDIDPKKGNVTSTVERRMVALGMVTPKVTEAQVGRWQKKSSSVEMDGVSNRIAELSGFKPEAAKEAYREFAEDPDEHFPVLPR